MMCDAQLRHNNDVWNKDNLKNENTKTHSTTTKRNSRRVDAYILNNPYFYQIIFVSNPNLLPCIDLALLFENY